MLGIVKSILLLDDDTGSWNFLKGPQANAWGLLLLLVTCCWFLDVASSLHHEQPLRYGEERRQRRGSFRRRHATIAQVLSNDTVINHGAIICVAPRH